MLTYKTIAQWAAVPCFIVSICIPFAINLSCLPQRPLLTCIDDDNDGLYDICETEVFGTDPRYIDTDNDGVNDGDEDHDGDGYLNAEEQDSMGCLCEVNPGQ